MGHSHFKVMIMPTPQSRSGVTILSPEKNQASPPKHLLRLKLHNFCLGVLITKKSAAEPPRENTLSNKITN